ncbi:MAG: dienelactone hydrolase family protein [Pseudomonadota bacterium]
MLSKNVTEIDFSSPDFPVRHVGQSQTYLAIFMHGYGSDGQDMAGLSAYFDQVLTDTVWLCPNAPGMTPMGGYQWFPLSDISQRELDNGAAHAAPWLHAFIDKALAFYNIPAENLILGGFSQGAMMAMHVAFRRKVAPMAVLAFSGALTSEALLETEIISRPKTFICHGENDDVVYASYAKRADTVLKSLNVPVETHIYPEYPHTIPPEGAKAAVEFLKKIIIPKALNNF